MNRLERVQATFVKKNVPQFEIGDTVRVHVKVMEGEKERIQVFEGAVIGRKGGRNAETFTVRKSSFGVWVERIFPIHSPVVERVDVVRQGPFAGRSSITCERRRARWRGSPSANISRKAKSNRIPHPPPRQRTKCRP